MANDARPHRGRDLRKEIVVRNIIVVCQVKNSLHACPFANRGNALRVMADRCGGTNAMRR
jgi:hypothetical protein